MNLVKDKLGVDKHMSKYDDVGERGLNIRLYSGKPYFPFDPHVEDIDIVDIAHALSLTNRFGGHTKFPVSVAQHSVCLLYTSPSPRDQRGSRMPSSA